MNVVTLGSRLRKQTLKDWTQYQRMCVDLGETPTLTHDMFLERNRGQLVADYVEGQKTLNAMMERGVAEGLIEAKVTNTFSITIRPDETRIDFDAFFALIQKLMGRTCFLSYTLSFEQKGTDDDTLGTGFHVHIVAKMTQRNKAQVARDVHNSVKACCDFQCVDVRLAKTPDKMIQAYLIDYESEDGHKAPTKVWDAKWREQQGLQPLYKDAVPPRITSL